MTTNYLLRAWSGETLGTERWTDWQDARRAAKRLRAAGYVVRVDWLTPDMRLLSVTHLIDNAAEPNIRIPMAE